jgi:GNAT superfamily N-acetyltransferase
LRFYFDALRQITPKHAGNRPNDKLVTATARPIAVIHIFLGIDFLMIEISTDPIRLDVPLIHRFLSEESTWALGISLAQVQKAIDNSLNFGAYEQGAQVGYARVITDYAGFAYLCDVFVPAAHRGRDISRRLMDAILSHPDLQNLRRFTLVSSSARDLYKQYGWTALKTPEGYMERYNPDVYLASN